MPASIGEVLAGCMEPTEPQTTILLVFRAMEGHKLRSRPVIKELARQCNRNDIRYVLLGNCYCIEWGTIDRPHGRLLASANIENPTLDPEWLIRNNPDMFARLRERNAIRKSAINNPDDTRFLAVEARLLQYKALSVELQNLFAFGGDLFPDKEQIQDAYGLRFDNLTHYPF